MPLRVRLQICCNGVCIPSDETNCGECGNACALSACTGAATCFRNSCIDAGILVITEMLIDPNASADNRGEWIEAFNPTARDIDIGGWTLRDDNLDLHTISTALPVIVPAGGYALLVRNNTALLNCGLAGDYEYGGDVAPGNDSDEVVLEVAGCEVDRFNYLAGFDTTGVASNLGIATLDAVQNDNPANWCDAMRPMDCGDLGTPGADNRLCP